MPLPLIPIILGGASAIAAGVGLKKGLDAKNDMDLAKSINYDAKDLVAKAENTIKTSKENATEAIESLGKAKIDVLSGSIHDFVRNFEKIRNIQFNDSEGLEELRHFNPQSPEFLQLKQVSMDAKDIAVNGIGALGGGALLAFGTYNVVMGGLGGLLVTATTGTALTSLSGVAATNATLAWLGGGALSAGGLGMMGGAAVLGGIVFGPALALGGALFAKQAEKAYWDAKSNLEQAEAFMEQAKGIKSTLKAIRKRAYQLKDLLEALNKPMIDLNADLRAIIRNQGTDWNTYNESDKRQIYKCVQMAQMIKIILDTSLLKEDGSLDPASKMSAEKGQAFLEQFQY